MQERTAPGNDVDLFRGLLPLLSVGILDVISLLLIIAVVTLLLLITVIAMLPVIVISLLLIVIITLLSVRGLVTVISLLLVVVITLLSVGGLIPVIVPLLLVVIITLLSIGVLDIISLLLIVVTLLSVGILDIIPLLLTVITLLSVRGLRGVRFCRGLSFYGLLGGSVGCGSGIIGVGVCMTALRAELGVPPPFSAASGAYGVGRSGGGFYGRLRRRGSTALGAFVAVKLVTAVCTL